MLFDSKAGCHFWYFYLIPSTLAFSLISIFDTLPLPSWIKSQSSLSLSLSYPEVSLSRSHPSPNQKWTQEPISIGTPNFRYLNSSLVLRFLVNIFVFNFGFHFRLLFKIRFFDQDWVFLDGFLPRLVFSVRNSVTGEIPSTKTMELLRYQFRLFLRNCFEKPIKLALFVLALILYILWIYVYYGHTKPMPKGGQAFVLGVCSHLSRLMLLAYGYLFSLALADCSFAIVVLQRKSVIKP